MLSIGYSIYSNKTLCEEHSDAILDYCKKKPACDSHNLNVLNSNIKRYFSTYKSGKIDSLEKLLCISVEDINGLKESFDQFPENIKKDILGVKANTKKGIIGFNGKINLVGLYDVFVRSKESFSSKYLASKSDIKTCPYCNENHIYHFSKSQRVYDWDHIYPKTKYPFFAVSFYNLVPCCKVCNFIKKAKSELFFNPHSVLNIDDIYTFSYKLGQSPSDFKIQLTFANGVDKDLKTRFENNFSAIKFKERIQEHKQILKQLINQKMKEKELISKLHQLGKTDIANSYIDSTWHYEKDSNYYYKMPFSKFKKDIIIQIG